MSFFCYGQKYRHKIFDSQDLSMEETKFRLVFKAEIAPGSDLNEVKKRLGAIVQI